MTRRTIAGIAVLGLALAGCSAATAEQQGAAPASSASAPSAATSSPAATGSPSSSSSPGATTPSSTSQAPSLLPTVSPDTVAAGGTLPVVHYRIKTSKNVFFITVDDGVTKQPAALAYVRARHLPVTTFLYNGVVDGQYGYFKAMSAWDAVQNHTMDHKALSKKSTDVRYEVCRAQEVYQKHFGVRPWLLRPPYGAGFMPIRAAATTIRQVAGSCGIRHVVLWDVSVEANGRVSFAGPSHLRAGDIVLLHYEGDLASNLKKVVTLGAARGLTAASLSAFLGR